MKGLVVQFRRGKQTIHERHFLLDFGAESREEAKKLAGKNVVWTSPAGRPIHGVISDAHGGKGLVRAIFEKGLPGQAVTTQVEIVSTPRPVKHSEKQHDLVTKTKAIKERMK